METPKSQIILSFPSLKLAKHLLEFFKSKTLTEPSKEEVYRMIETIVTNASKSFGDNVVVHSLIAFFGQLGQ